MVLFEQVEGHFTHQGQVLGRLVFAQAVVVLAEGDVELSMQGVFNGPVPAHEAIGLFRREAGPTAEVVALVAN